MRTKCIDWYISSSDNDDKILDDRIAKKKVRRPCATTFARKLPEVPTDGTDNLGDQVHSKNKIRLFMKSLWRLVVMSKRRNVKMTRRRKHRLSMLARRETYWQCFELEKKPRLFYTLVKSPQVFCNLHWSWTKLARSIPAHNWHLLGTVYSQKNHWSQPLIHFDTRCWFELRSNTKRTHVFFIFPKKELFISFF